jgi:hypothetical protein
MGLFNDVRCRYRLPDPEAQDFAFQTKSLPEQLLDEYEITEDGRLLHRAYDTRFEENAEAPLRFRIQRENYRWEAVDFTGELEIHTSAGGLWYSYLIEFDKGQLVGLQHGSRHGVPLPNHPR